MKNKIDAVQLQRTIRAKLSGKNEKFREAELEELPKKFGHLRKPKAVGRSR